MRMNTYFSCIAILSKYKDKCSVGSFPCANSTKCILQRYWCNKKYDCPERDDESETECFDLNGDWDHIYQDYLKPQRPLPTCESVISPPRCKIEECHVTCFEQKEIPQTFSVNVTTIILNNNFLTQLSANVFENYTELQKLLLKNNSIRNLEIGTFKKQAQLENLILTKNYIHEIHRGHFTGLVSLKRLFINENKITIANLFDFENSTSLGWLNLNNNSITVQNLSLPYLPVLDQLFLDENNLEEIPETLFAGLPKLKTLSLEGNKIKRIAKNAFQHFENLTELNLAYNKIKKIEPILFQSLVSLQKLSIGYNFIENFPVTALDTLKDLRSLGIEDIDLDNFEKHFFNLFPNLNFIYFKRFQYCSMFAPNVKKCRPISDGVSSLSHLLGKPILRAAVWGISCVTCLGNSLVLWGRLTAKDENRVLSIVIKHLAVSDMLMGIYLFIIALEDIRFRDNYHLEASSWMSSWSCTLIGIVAMTSSEVSVLILSFMSVERFMLIAAPLKKHRALSPQAASSSMIIVWITGITLALIPAIHWRSSTRFYGVNGMCFPLHIDDPFFIGWEYSAFIFLGLNFIGLITIGYVYTGMFVSIWQTRHATPLSVGDSEFALRFFLIVLTDAACWAPIIILKILALMKYPIPPDLHSWVVVFILPVNSAVNPLLYTFTTPKFRERLNGGKNETCRKKRWKNENFILKKRRDSNRKYLPNLVLKYFFFINIVYILFIFSKQIEYFYYNLFIF
ncbi:relaxin receptor 1 isoform X2 [Leptopilina boulardi]|uniref:relaxin receptor 1 isoform X2 n=1 Tax=Leptopilina boulardi TaxID=63433 RepID=UPI0021F5240E|nr:relaxin receptor 1 isoform X2 [Leptopilina boulardi]